MAERDDKGRWQKGKSANPNGRPKKAQTVTNLISEYMELKPKGRTMTRKHLLVKGLFDLAIGENDFQAMKYIIDRVDGLPTARHEIEQMETPELKLVMDQFVDTMIEAKKNGDK